MIYYNMGQEADRVSKCTAANTICFKSQEKSTAIIRLQNTETDVIFTGATQYKSFAKLKLPKIKEKYIQT